MVEPGRPMELTLREARPEDAAECGRICYEAFAAIAARHGFPPDFPSVEAGVAVLTGAIGGPGFYVVVAEIDGRIIGSNVLDERSTIAGVGPISVDPEVQDRKVGRALMNAVLERGRDRAAAGVRLMQVAYHNRSLSLYAQLGFDVRDGFAAMTGEPLGLEPDGVSIRPATTADLEACNHQCRQVHGHDRAGELDDAVTRGAAKVVERDGQITGYSTGVSITGHSIGERNADLQALISAAERFGEPGFLVPLRNTDLLRWCLGHGLRVFFMMNLMTIGQYEEPRGPFLPSVLY